MSPQIEKVRKTDKLILLLDQCGMSAEVIYLHLSSGLLFKFFFLFFIAVFENAALSVSSIYDS